MLFTLNHNHWQTLTGVCDSFTLSHTWQYRARNLLSTRHPSGATSSTMVLRLPSQAGQNGSTRSPVAMPGGEGRPEAANTANADTICAANTCEQVCWAK